MKKKQIAMLLGLVITVVPTAAYAQESDMEVASEAADGAEVPDDLPDEVQEASQMVMGTVTEIGEDFITVSVSAGIGGGDMEMPEGEAGPDGADGESSGNGEESVDGEASAEDAEAGEETGNTEDEVSGEVETLEAVTETQTITLTDETQYLKMAGSSENGMGDAESGDGETREIPDGESGEANPGDSEGADGEAPSGYGEGADGEAPSGDGEGADGEAPSGDGEGAGGEAPSGDGEGAGGEAPSGDGPGGEGAGGDMGDRGMGGSAETEEITLADIEVGDTVIITLNDDGTAATVTVQSGSFGMGGGNMSSTSMGEGGMGGNMGGGQSSGVDSYDAVNTITEDTTIDSEEISSTGTDENAVLVSSDVTVTLTNDTIVRTSDDSTGGDNSSFYGVGAALLATDGTLIVSDSTISTDSEGGAGVFAYGDGVVYVMDTVIDTQLNTSGGIHVAGGGTLYAWDVTATTNGTSSAAVRSDRGSGTMVVDGGTYTSNGSDSPAVYCTAEIAISDATLTSTAAEAVCIEGLNTLRLYDCDLTGMAPDDERNDVTWTVIVYQSMSGDSEVGNGTFQMVGGTLTSANGGLFYTTNTECTITLEDVEITAADDCEFFLQCTGNTNSRGWGTTGSNGSDCLFTAINQTMDGDVIWDTISILDFYMTDGSTLTGAIVNDETWAGEGGSGYCNVVISEDSAWIVTGDSTVTSLSCSGTITDADGNTVSVVGTDGTVYVEGSSAYTITVESWSDSADTSGASTTDSFEDYAVERPEV